MGGPREFLIFFESLRKNYLQYCISILLFLVVVVGGLLVIEKIKNSRGWIQYSSTAQPREFLIFFESLRKNYLQYCISILLFLVVVVGGLLVIEKIKNSRGWIQYSSTAQPREFLIFFESLRKNYVQYCIYSKK